MALTLTELFVTPGDDHKRQATWMITGDGSSYQINVADLKMSKVEAAWTENVNNDTELKIRIDNYDYLSGPVTILELGDEGADALLNGKKHLLFVIGY
jgi:hypothetical protein